jgi:hypothetical protein
MYIFVHGVECFDAYEVICMTDLMYHESLMVCFDGVLVSCLGVLSFYAIVLLFSLCLVC